MTARNFFLSYSRRDTSAAAALAAELHSFGQDVWRDEELSGGQKWWDAILEQIRRCDCFMFAQSRASLESKACMAELEYAYMLRKPILPVVVGETPPDGLLKHYLAEAQRVDAREPGKITHTLAKALFALPSAPALPDPLPSAPPVPISYMDELTSKMGQAELSMSEQRNLVADIKQQLAPDREPEAGRELLQLMRKRDDLYASVATEIDGILKSTSVTEKVRPTPPVPPSAEEKSTPSGPPATGGSPPRRHSRWVIALAVFGAIVLGLIALGMMMQPECGYDYFGNYVCQ